jgi:cytochrome P450
MSRRISRSRLVSASPIEFSWLTLQGPRGCVGKEFAMMSMRIFLSRLAMNFDIGFAPGEDGIEFDTCARDYLAIDVGPLFLVISGRVI